MYKGDPYSTEVLVLHVHSTLQDPDIGQDVVDNLRAAANTLRSLQGAVLPNTLGLSYEFIGIMTGRNITSLLYFVFLYSG